MLNQLLIFYLANAIPKQEVGVGQLLRCLKGLKALKLLNYVI